MKQITMNDIAIKAKVARSTVSEILNSKPKRNSSVRISDATRNNVLSIARQLNFQPNLFAQSLKTGKTGCIGISTLTAGRSFIRRFDEPYLGLVYSGIGRVVSERHYKLIFQDVQHHEEAAQLARQRMVDGIIFIKSSINADQFQDFQEKYLSQLNVPYVIVHSGQDPLGAHCVSLDCVQGGLAATEHLLDHGHQRIGFVSSELGWSFRDDLYKGYCEALQKHGLSNEKGLLFKTELAGEYHGMEQGFRLADLMIREKNIPGALFVADDATAHGMLACFARNGVRVPEDIALAAFGDEPPFLNIQNGITCLRQPAKVKGRTAAELLFELINDPEKQHAPRHVVLNTELRVRKSCGCTGFDYIKEVREQRDADKAL
jgi:LacI family transcriptional regulator